MTSPETKISKLYCFDTSAFVMLSRTSENIIQLPNKIWEHLEKMMENLEIVSHDIVFSEISSGTKNPDFITRWVANKKASFLKKTDAQFIEVSKIVKTFPGLIDFDQEHEQADPWIIALAIEKSRECSLFEKCECSVVSQESPKSPKKIPAVCKSFNVRHLSLKEFFDEIGLSAEIKIR